MLFQVSGKKLGIARPVEASLSSAAVVRWVDAVSKTLVLGSAGDLKHAVDLAAPDPVVDLPVQQNQKKLLIAGNSRVGKQLSQYLKSSIRPCRLC